ncbi:NUDIX domain-containing protein [Glycomyces paridis]|uniref:Oxidized purine nucleoside triphosphate hydrolase n=1 Tax=Glycomyces paridis TaxID=2126555 RepID=A0A4S8PA30_9ACTN|nr:NUDIX domain-containing protein [Glycomyces paridis]
MTFTPVSLCLLTRTAADGRREVLLGRKKRGFGVGKVVGPGGHVESGESAAEAAARETTEETGLAVAVGDLRAAANVTFRFPAKPAWDMRVAVFTGERFAGEARETEELAPRWYPVDALPIDEMWSDNRLWLPQVLEGRRLDAAFVFAEDGETVAESHVAIVAEDWAE